MTQNSIEEKYMEFDKETGRVIMHNWPVLPPRNEGYLRTPKEVAERAMALHLLIGVIFYHTPEEIVQWAIEEQLWDAITPDEKKIFSIPVSDELSPEEKQWQLKRLQTHRFTWRLEGLLALLWCLKKVDKLEPPIRKCDGGSLVSILPMPGDSLQAWIRNAELRSSGEIAQQLIDHLKMYRRHVEAYHRGEKTVYDLYILYERCHALNWVSGLIDQWDD
jgi:hypothetical protein